MRYVFLFTSSPDLDAAVDPAEAQADYQEIFGWFQKWGAEGKIAEGGAELHPVNTATTVRHDAGSVVTVDGPFMEAKEVIGGFSIIEAADLDEALAIARTWPSLRRPGNSVEIRPEVDHSGS
jgi:hypothetical protein